MAEKITYHPLLSAEIEMFKRGMFDFVTICAGLKHLKQEQALQVLNCFTGVPQEERNHGLDVLGLLFHAWLIPAQNGL